MRIKIPRGFDINVFDHMNEGLDPGIENKRNVIGSSQSMSCMRAVVIKKVHGIKTRSNNKMLFGKIIEEVIQNPNILSLLIADVNHKLGIDLKRGVMGIKTQPQKLLEVRPKQFLRCTPDIYTNRYMIEIKTTGLYAREWKRELAVHQIPQLNVQLGMFEQELGFILKINSRAFLASIKQDDIYWNELWNKYGYFLPWYFKQNMYDSTIERIKFLFEYIDAEDYDLKGPTFKWECKHCDEKVRRICGKEEYSCAGTKCYKKMYEFPIEVTNKFMTLPLCEKCFKKANPYSKYLKYRYINYKEKEKENG